MKRKNVLIILIVFIVIVLLVGIPMYYYFNMESIYRKEKFEEKKDSFIVLAEFFNELYREYAVEVQSDMVSYIEDVIEAFGHYGWNKTIVTEDSVSFSNEGNWYAFVYVNDGKEPKHMNSAIEPFEIKSKYLGDSCYFVESK